MIYRLKCIECGKEHIVEINKPVDKLEEEKTFGFVGERMEVIESDITYCKDCGAKLPLP